MFPIGAILEVDSGWYRHIGVVIGNGMILHNHRERGEEVVPINAFAEGKQVKARITTPIDHISFFSRVNQTLLNPRAYHLIQNNCEHTVTRVLYGAASSPQLIGYGFAALIISSMWLLSRKG